MNYKKVIKDFGNGTLSKEKWQLVMDNDGGYWCCIDKSLSDDEQQKSIEAMEEKYGTPDGYRDVVDILVAAGVNAEWC